MMKQQGNKTTTSITQLYVLRRSRRAGTLEGHVEGRAVGYGQDFSEGLKLELNKV